MKYCGIYFIVCSKNQAFYIGSTNNSERRWKDHRKLLVENVHFNPHLQHIWNKYGEDSIGMYIIQELSPEDLKVRETEYLQQFHGTEGCLNLSKDALAVMRGIVKTQQHRERIASGVTRYFNEHPEAREYLGSLRRGVKMSDTARDNMKKSANRGVKHHNAVLTERDAISIREKYQPRIYSYGMLAREYGVDRKTIIRIVKGKTWTHC